MPKTARLARFTTFAVSVAALPGLVLLAATPASGAPAAGPGGATEVPPDVRAANTHTGVVAPALRTATGTVDVSVRLSEASLAETVADGSLRTGTLPDAATQRARIAAVTDQQDRFVRQARAAGATELGRSSIAANAVAVRVDAGRVDQLAQLPGVLSVKPIARYEVHAEEAASGSLAQAAQYLQADAAWAAGYNGRGIEIAVLDSGVDYTHRNLGGPGTVAAYRACYALRNVPPSGPCAQLFGPGAPKVIGGYDFVGEAWNGSTVTTLSPDANPIDREGHGTHVSDISAGHSADDTHRGIAYGAGVYAFKVCSAVATSCSGVALLQAVDRALDPNGNGDISDAVDVMNLSLGSDYGQPQDDLTVALDNAVRAGVTVVASAGNGSDHPFKVGSPSTAARVISVAQTALPDDKLYPIRVTDPPIPGLPDNTIRYSVLQSWGAPLTSPVSGSLAQPDDNLGCDASDFAGFPAGAVALIMRGACAASLKAQNAQDAGAVAAIIWNNVPGDPPSFSFGGGEPVVIPTVTISMDRGQQLATAEAAGEVNVVIDPADAIALTNTTVATSSRGPRIADGLVKPDIGAPGAWLSAEVGTGKEETNFGGTSGAAPVVTGAAALVLDRHPAYPPALVKSQLLNNASTANRTPDSDANFYPTPITRIGAGEVRIGPAVLATGALLNRQLGNGNVSLDTPRLSTPQDYSVRLTLLNTGTDAKLYRLDARFRDPADAALGAVRLQAPRTVAVPAGSNRDVTLVVSIDPAKLPEWPFANAAGYTGDGSALNAPEIDGYLAATAQEETLHLGWQVLPRRAADVSADRSVTLGPDGTGQLGLRNRSRVQDGVANVYGLTGTSGLLPIPGPGDPGSPGSNVAVIDLLGAGVRDDVATDLLQFAISGRQRQAVPLYPAGYEVDIDTDQDGSVDFAVFQQEQNGFGATGISLVTVLDVATGVATPYYFTIADFDSATQVFSVPLSALGLSRGSTFDFDLVAYDNYFSGLVSDSITGMSWTVDSPKYSLANDADTIVVPAGGQTRVAVTGDTSAGPSSQTGLLLLLDSNLSNDAQAVTVTP